MTWPGHDGTLSCDAAHEQITLLSTASSVTRLAIGWNSIWPAASIAAMSWRSPAPCRARWLSCPSASLPPNLLAQTRLKIDEALEQAPHDTWIDPPPPLALDRFPPAAYRAARGGHHARRRRRSRFCRLQARPTAYRHADRGGMSLPTASPPSPASRRIPPPAWSMSNTAA